MASSTGKNKRKQDSQYVRIWESNGFLYWKEYENARFPLWLRMCERKFSSIGWIRESKVSSIGKNVRMWEYENAMVSSTDKNVRKHWFPLYVRIRE